MIPFVGVSTGNSTQIAPEALLYQSAVIANGGSISSMRFQIVNNFIMAEKINGNWAITDDYWGLWAENEIQALTSLKQCRLAVAVNSPVFTPNRDYTFDGVSNYIDTRFNPSTNAIAMNSNNLGIGLYNRTNVNSAGFAAGVRNAANRRLTIRPRFGSNATVEGGGLGAVFTLATSDSRGLLSGGRFGPAVSDIAMYQQGIEMVKTSNLTGLGATLPSGSIFIGGVNNAGLTVPCPESVGFMWTGAMPTASQALSRYYSVNAWATSIGAQV